MSPVQTLFLRLPSSAALLLLATVLARTDAHALPRQTVTIDYRELDVLPYPPLPTAASLLPRDLRKRQLDNTICGYVGGDPDLPATCSAGSHCVVDQGVGAIGCCPNGDAACTTGVFTGCVDANSGPQTEVNPYVFTCAGSDVCYRNTFEGGNFQYGCGSASNMAATVVATASGVTAAPLLATVSAPMTATPSQLSEPTTLGSASSDSQTTSSATSSGSSSSSSTSTSSEPSSSASSATSSGDASSTQSTTESSTPTGEPVTEAPDASSSGGVNRTGAIIGGTISGAAVLIGLIVVGLFCWKRRRGNKRQGPGPNDSTRFISPMTGASGFAPIGSGQDTYEQAYMPSNNGNTTTILGNKGMSDPGRHPVHSTSELDQPFGYGPSGEVIPMRATHHAPAGSAATAGAPAPNDDQVPLTQEYDDFSRGFNDALTRIDEEDSRPVTAVNGNGMSGNGNAFATSEDEADQGAPRYVRGGGGGPLWQQNRQQSSRNMMWM